MKVSAGVVSAPDWICITTKDGSVAASRLLGIKHEVNAAWAATIGWLLMKADEGVRCLLASSQNRQTWRACASVRKACLSHCHFSTTASAW